MVVVLLACTALARAQCDPFVSPGTTLGCGLYLANCNECACTQMQGNINLLCTSMAKWNAKHVHRLTWFFSGTPTAGVQATREIVPDGLTNCAITASEITANTTASSSSTWNIQRCTANFPNQCTSTANVAGSNNTLGSSTQTAFGTVTTSTITADDIFKINLVTVGTSLANVTVALTFACDN